MYNKKTWNNGEVITAQKLNNIEEGIYNVNSQISEILEIIEKDDAEAGLFSWYNPDLEFVSESFESIVVNNNSTTFIIGEPIKEKCFINNLKFITNSDVTITLFTREDGGSGLDTYVTFKPYARYSISREDANFGILKTPIEITKENTYIGLFGEILYKMNFSSDKFINKMYDFKSTPVINTPVEAQLSGIVIWFAMQLETSYVVDPILRLEEVVNRELEILNNKINALENASAPSGSLSTNPVGNLKQVWDLDLSQSNVGWVSSNATLESGNGILCPANSRAYYNQYLTFDTYQQKSVVVVKDVNSQFGLMCYNGSKGALYLVDGVNKRISLHAQFTGSTIPAVKASTPLPFDLKVNGKYLLNVIKTGWKHTFTITDIETMEECTVEFDNATQSSSGLYCGKGWGCPGVTTFTGNVLFKNHKYYVALYPKARALFIGDSITEGTNMGANVDIKYRWCSLLRDNYFNYDAIICGRGGATSDDVLSRLNALEAVGVNADVVVVLDGTNERNQNAVNNWKVKMPQIREKIISWGAKPIICVPPVPSSGFEYIAQMRDFILEQGWDTIRMDIATSLNGDGVTYDGSLYTDGVHPNKKGGEQMYARAIKDLNIIL